MMIKLYVYLGFAKRTQFFQTFFPLKINWSEKKKGGGGGWGVREKGGPFKG